MNVQKFVQYLLIAILVIVLGALAGWYLFLHAQSIKNQALSTDLGLGAPAPFGTTQGTSGGFSTMSASTSTGTGGSAQPPQLWHVTTAPIAGFAFASSTDGMVVRYVERATGYVFEANLTTGTIVRLTNTLSPKIYEAQFAPPDRVAERSIDNGGNITTFAGLYGVGTSSALTGTSFAANIEALAADPSSNNVFSLIDKGSGVVGVISGWDGSKPKQVFSSGVPGWRAWWLPDGRIVLEQNAADSVLGYSYVLRNGAQTPLIDPLPGLTAIPQSGSAALLYSTSQNGALSLYVRPAGSSTPLQLPLATLADKCAWAPNSPTVYCGAPQTTPGADFLDAWYRGEAHSADAMWSIDTSSGKAAQIFAPSSSAALDVDEPSVDGSGSYFGFINASDLSLWVLRLGR